MANYKSDGWKVVVCTFPKLTPIYRKIGKVTTGPNRYVPMPHVGKYGLGNLKVVVFWFQFHGIRSRTFHFVDMSDERELKSNLLNYDLI